MSEISFKLTQQIEIGGDNPPVLFAGPCVIENEEMVLRHAAAIAEISDELNIPFIFKASYDKANRTSLDSYRGPGLDEGIRILMRVREELNIPVITDFHSIREVRDGADKVDVIQIPAFLCRQTDLITEAAESGKPVNVKKGQFLAPADVENIIDKLTGSGCEKILITERGSSFGYNRLVVDFAGIVDMSRFGYPLVFDATHSVQSPGGLGGKSGGDRSKAPYLAWASAAVGVDALFLEVHEDPDNALSDGPNMIKISELSNVLKKFAEISSLN